MANRKKSAILFSLVALTAILISACVRSASNAPSETPDAEGTSLFVSPFPTSDNPMAMVEELSTGTALAETAAALTAGTPLAPAAGTEITPDSNATATLTLDISTGATATSTLGSNVTPGTTQQAPTVTVNRPASYTLQKGEFPYCIARRFNIDPAELLNLNGLVSGDIYYPNLTLTIPQSGKSFPETRALRSHPDTYTVADSTLTVNGLACVYGDVDPAAIIQANPNLSLSLGTNLPAGQQIAIP
jgi:LysM repeat protein